MRLTLHSKTIQFMHARLIHFIKEKAFVNGNWVKATNHKMYPVRNPANGVIIGNVPDMAVEDVEKAVMAAKEAFVTWGETTALERSVILRRWYDSLVENSAHVAEIITLESGKPLSEATAEVQCGNSYVAWFSEEARRIYGETIPSPTRTRKIVTERQPIGVVGLITSWSFPFALVARKASAALAAGCTCVIKPSPLTPLTTLAMAQLAIEAGMPKGVINVVTSTEANTSAVGAFLCSSPDVAGISFTGSTAVGRLLYRQCADCIKRIGFELGGNTSFIVFKSANLDQAVRGVMVAKFRNCGQSCIAPNRILVQEEVSYQFVSKLTHHMTLEIKMGNGIKPGVNLGPMVHKNHLQKVIQLVNDAVEKGAKLILGGKTSSRLGELFYEPTLLIDLNPSMMLYTREIFGPVAPVFLFKTEEDALKIANDTTSGLAAYIYTQDIAQVYRVSRALDVGVVGVNEEVITAVEAPFGGIKESGLGREGARSGVDDFTFTKYMCIGNL